MKEFYEKNRQTILYAVVVCAAIFFLFYWTAAAIDSKERSYIQGADQTYERLEKAVALAVKVRQSEAGKTGLTGGLLSFVQQTCAGLGISDKLVNLRPVASSANIEHVSLRLENLYYDEFVNFLSRIELYDNLRIKSLSFTRRYDNPRMIDAAFEVVKS